jgi:hypothetical protein
MAGGKGFLACLCANKKIHPAKINIKAGIKSSFLDLVLVLALGSVFVPKSSILS